MSWYFGNSWYIINTSCALVSFVINTYWKCPMWTKTCNNSHLMGKRPPWVLKTWPLVPLLSYWGLWRNALVRKTLETLGKTKVKAPVGNECMFQCLFFLGLDGFADPGSQVAQQWLCKDIVFHVREMNARLAWPGTTINHMPGTAICEVLTGTATCQVQDYP